MRRDLVFKYLTGTINRLELVGRHLRGEMINKDVLRSIVIADESVDLSDADIDIIHLLLESISQEVSQLNELVREIKSYET